MAVEAGRRSLVPSIDSVTIDGDEELCELTAMSVLHHRDIVRYSVLGHCDQRGRVAGQVNL